MEVIIKESLGLCLDKSQPSQRGTFLATWTGRIGSKHGLDAVFDLFISAITSCSVLSDWKHVFERITPGLMYSLLRTAFESRLTTSRLDRFLHAGQIYASFSTRTHLVWAEGRHS